MTISHLYTEGFYIDNILIMYKNLNIEQILCLLLLDFKIRQNTPIALRDINSSLVCGL